MRCCRIMGDVYSQLLIDAGTAEKREMWITALNSAVSEVRSKNIESKLLEEIFHEVDKDKNGLLDRNEIGQLTRKVGLDLDVSQLTVLYLSMDVDKSGLIDWDEFRKWYYLDPGATDTQTDAERLRTSLVDHVRKVVTTTDDWIHHIFKKYDGDANEQLDFNEIEKVAVDLGMQLSHDELNTAFQEMVRSRFQYDASHVS
eukprot:SAG31_NODE_3132_length_4639_cov_3.668502_2_plen_200_part_00